MPPLAEIFPRLPNRLLGLFVTVQIYFLFAGNFLPLLPHGVPDSDEITDNVTMPGRTFEDNRLQSALDIVGTSTRRYGELTGQMQGWSLFAPLVAHQSTFLVAELHWHEKEGEPARKVELVSDFHPENPHHYAHWPKSNCRLFNYEFRISQSVWYLTNEGIATEPAFWQEYVTRRVARQWKSIQAYLQFREQNYLREHPEALPADELKLVVRSYPIVPPGGQTVAFPQPTDRPLARIRREGTLLKEVLPVEAFDPVSQQYVSLFLNSSPEANHE